ncbi:Polyol:NADP oxidoreductase [Delftia tsuruhatensis]|uniref:D-arabinitol 4-dehydrogenase n=1 Tax=Delftia tsuruhatensis TaxID=180282 RepID=UPI001E6A8833|nr:D-arabinitol 4-dehydrogenase [Delftia tsuruhatensis]CAB5664703.1 Polyol:NADP oxidoreductase [Delftia tsuruhatensis]CAC9677453.1 Polyol:NADP oxidoreductase [Delftia tsuruhatensis]
MNATVLSSSGPTVLHLGLGSFHRAHQAAYLQRLIDAGDTQWALVGANLRPDMTQTLDALARQGGAYTLETIAPDGEVRYQRIEALREVIAHAPGLAAVVARGAEAATRIISFTVTEAGYCLDGSGVLDASNPELAADVARARQGQVGQTIHGVLCAILQARCRAQTGPVTLLSCDNLRHNGDRLRAGLMAFLQLAQLQDLARWAERNVSCPNAMVDRITPRPPSELRARVRAATGWDDAAPVMAESFTQWVIEDRFIAGRPAWERVGVEMVASVAPYEEAKIRILNASHSCIAWAGTLAGQRFIHEGIAMPAIRKMAWDYVTQDVIACLAVPGQPSALDLPAYRDTVLERFGNAALCDTNQRVAADGFAKIPGFIAPTVRERLAQKAPVDAVAMLPALFLAFLQRWHHGTLPYAYEDQAMDPVAAHAICAAADPVAALCAQPSLWGAAAGHPRLVEAVRRATDRLHACMPSSVKQQGGCACA